MVNWRVFIVIMFLLVTIPAQAQDTISYGEPVTGEISDEVTAQVYTFFGKRDEVVAINIAAVERFADLDRPMLVLQDPEGQTLAEHDSFAVPRIFALLPFDGSYTVIATRPENDDSVGEYTLSVDLIPEIKLNAPVTDTVTTEGGDHLYVYRGDTDFFVAYSKSAGDFGPEISVNVIDDSRGEGQLDLVGALRGKLMRRGTMGAFPGSDLYIIRLSEAAFEFNFGELTATYELELLDAAKLE